MVELSGISISESSGRPSNLKPPLLVAPLRCPSQTSINGDELIRLRKTTIQHKGPLLKTLYIFIDFENVQPKDLALFKGREFKVMIFVGATQAKLPTEFAMAVQGLGAAAEYVKIDGSGCNALDFHITYYPGSTSAAGLSGESFVISKDTGFDPLMRHLKAKGFSCRRLSSIGDIPGLKEAAVKPSSDPLQRILANLAKRAPAKPHTIKTLRSSINTCWESKGQPRR